MWTFCIECRIPGTFERKALNAAQNWLNFDQCAFKYSFKRNTTLLKQKVVWICIWILYWMSSWWSLKRKHCALNIIDWALNIHSRGMKHWTECQWICMVIHWSRLLAIALILIILIMIYMNLWTIYKLSQTQVMRTILNPPGATTNGLRMSLHSFMYQQQTNSTTPHASANDNF